MSTHSSVPVTSDPDVGLHVARQRRQRAVDPGVLAVIAVGGVVGSEARYALHVWSPGGDGGWPWGTWWANTAGSLLLGALMVVLTELTSPHRLLRPFLGVGVIGGFTTFSTVMVEVPGLMAAGRPGMALGYLVGTAVAALVAVAVGVTVIRVAAAWWHSLRRGRSR
jgi:fluoride exporter